jgi:hypothetical protein
MHQSEMKMQVPVVWVEGVKGKREMGIDQQPLRPLGSIIPSQLALLYSFNMILRPDMQLFNSGITTKPRLLQEAPTPASVRNPSSQFLY